MGASRAVSSHSLSRAILQRTRQAEAAVPLRVIVVDQDAPRDVSMNLKEATLAAAADHLVVLDVRDHEDLHGVNVVAIPAGQKEHALYEAAEVRRRSRMLG